MGDRLEEIGAEFLRLVAHVKLYQSRPCFCDRSSEEALEETLAECVRCHVDSILDETMEHARGVIEFLDGMADRNSAGPRQRAVKRTSQKQNVLRFHPAARHPQPARFGE